MMQLAGNDGELSVGDALAANGLAVNVAPTLIEKAIDDTDVAFG